MGFIEKWKAGENGIGRWLAETKTGVIVKTGIGPALLWIGQQAGDWGLPPISYVVIAAIVPVAVNMLNPADDRMGIGKDDDGTE
jgi:hypothetical protein